MKMKCKKNRHIKWLPHVLTAVLLFILAVFYCGYQKVYTIEKFSITGNYELTDSDVTAISGIKLGEKIFKCNLDAAMSRLNSHPYIRYIYISRQFPNTIKIEIKERRPLALLMTDDAYAIDKYSVILPVPEKNKITKPVIFAYDMNCNAIPGQIIDCENLRYMVNMIDYIQFAHPDVKYYCQDIIWNGPRGWVIRNNNLPPVYIGRNNLRERADILQAFIGTMDKEEKNLTDYKYISLRFNRKVFVREKI